MDINEQSMLLLLALGLALLAASTETSIPVGLIKLLPEKSLAHFAPAPMLALVGALLVTFRSGCPPRRITAKRGTRLITGNEASPAENPVIRTIERP
ncbi:hypothetical protein [Acidithiobacillus ferrooxidans]|uniref:hypothetical protein n=1 Tax=Acidithiobacillus ferrooxidans TaxID=920 RepID=UPI001C07A32C|nr:hypothetical protein [Acidithiobacillus ferrooxidans]